jgi:hypothetical protein
MQCPVSLGERPLEPGLAAMAAKLVMTIMSFNDKIGSYELDP